jgi:hypothetical protein
MTWYEVGALVLSALTLGVLFWTLKFLRTYTSETAVLARCAVEQMPRPCVTIAEERDSTDIAVLESTVVSLEKVRHLRLTNVGTGPAVNLRFSIRALGSPQNEEPYRGPVLGPTASFDSGVSTNALPDPALVVIEYGSLGGLKYQTEVTIEARRWIRAVRFSQRNPALHQTGAVDS